MTSKLTMAFLGLCALGGIAGRAAAEESPQQMKTQVCNDEASALQLSGDERKHFMADCLSEASGSARQVRLKSCTAEAQAKSLQGEERRAFMRDCLSAK